MGRGILGGLWHYRFCVMEMGAGIIWEATTGCISSELENMIAVVVASTSVVALGGLPYICVQL